MPCQPELSIGKTIARWWEDERNSHSLSITASRLVAKLWEFVRDSTPQRRKQRYGDADYDWEERVNTTAATVGWRDRLLGHFLSPYQPTEPSLFHEMLRALELDFSQFTFIDVGSGKGRTLLMAADYPFKHIVGVEIFPELHAIAEANIRSYGSARQKCFSIESLCQDARSFIFPGGPLLLYLFNPLPEAGLAIMLNRVEQALSDNWREVYVLYHNPELERLFGPEHWKKIHGTHQYSVFEHLPLK